MIRKKVWGLDMDMNTNGDDLLEMDHLDHCIDSVRQSLMCSSDISTITWTWDEEDQMSKPQADMIHTCRDFEAIRDWGLKNQAKKFDVNQRVSDPLSQ